MRVPGDRVEARFLDRPNRFLIRAEAASGPVEAFLPNPGRLTELLTPGTPLLLRPVADPARRTGYDVLAVAGPEGWVCLDTRLANALAREALAAGRVPGLWPYRRVVAEARHGRSRFDFRLEGATTGYLEVKAVTLLDGRTARFPDAPTTRGTRHLDDLLARRRRSHDAAVLFLVHRPAAALQPNDRTDPAFGRALRRARAGGVRVLAHRAPFDGLRLTLGRRVPVDLREPSPSDG